MPGLTGLEAAPLVREQAAPPAVVFVTAHPEYAVDAFAVEALDYLLKPVDPDRLARVIERLEAREPEATEAGRKGSGCRGGGYGVWSTSTRSTTFRPTATTAACTPTTAPTSARRRWASSRRLSPTRFARVHRSHIVNLAKVAAVQRVSSDRIRLALADADRTELDVARRQSRRLRERLRL